MPLITRKGQVTIPKPLRESVGLKEGDSVMFFQRGGEIVLRRQERKSILRLGGIASSGRRTGKAR